MHKARCGERVQSFHTLSEDITLFKFPSVHQSGKAISFKIKNKTGMAIVIIIIQCCCRSSGDCNRQENKILDIKIGKKVLKIYLFSYI